MGNRILIVEDESIIAAHLANTLKRHDYDIVGICASGRVAIDLAKKTRPDLLLIDIRIEGDLDGVETAVHINNLYDVPMPVVFLTALAHEKIPALAGLSTYCFLRKPIRDEELIDVIQRGLVGTGSP